MIINELLTEDPQAGDSIDLEFGDTLIETVIESVTEDGVVVRLDETAMAMILEARKQYIAESAIEKDKSGNPIRQRKDVYMIVHNGEQKGYYPESQIKQAKEMIRAMKKKFRGPDHTIELVKDLREQRVSEEHKKTPMRHKDYEREAERLHKLESEARHRGDKDAEEKYKQARNELDSTVMKHGLLPEANEKYSTATLSYKMRDDAQSMTRSEFVKKYPGRGDVWDNVNEVRIDINGERIDVNRPSTPTHMLHEQYEDAEEFEKMTDKDLIKRCQREGLGKSCRTDGHGTLLNREECIDQLKELTKNDGKMDEAKYQGREVPLGKPMKGDVAKSKVYVKGPKGNVVKVNFGQKGVKIKKSNPGRRKNFRARHNCDNPGPRWKARYWSCRAW